MDKNTVYDFVIVGGGTAGLVLANRLTEDKDINVLVLEAGTNKLNDPRITIPGLSSALYNNDEFDWNFKTVPQRHLYDKVITYPRGKTIGGSSAINILSLVFPNKSSIDSWGHLGNEGWSWEHLLPYYRKFHTFSPPSAQSRQALGIDYVDESIQGRDGPIKSSYPDFVGPLVEAWPLTLKNLGWAVTGDPLTGETTGGFNGPYSVNPNGRVRSHAGNEYYAPVAHRSNLHVQTEALVERINFAEGNTIPLQAQSVSFSIAGDESVKVHASKEIILAAGVFQSPQLLEISGIGNKDILQSFNIPVLLDNPNVGENLQDHAMTGMCAEVKDGVPTGDARRDPSFAAKAREMYDQKFTGPLTAGFPSLAFMPLEGWCDTSGLAEAFESHLGEPPSATEHEYKRSSRSDQQTRLQNIISAPREASIQLCLGASQVHFDKSSYGDVFGVTEPENYVAILVSLPHPFSAGTCHITSSDPRDLPTVDPRFMSHPLDPEIMGRHMVALDQLFTEPPLADLIKLGGRRLPARSPLFDPDSTKTSKERIEAGREHARRYTRSTSHPCGTCAMLPWDKGGVVDFRLRVHCVKGLRIVDASIFPMVVRGNIQSTVYAVAERAADFIKEDWGLALNTSI